MIQLYRGSGSGELELLNEALPLNEWNTLRTQTCRLLRARKENLAAEELESIPFEIRDGTNTFGDEFSALYCSLPMKEYVALAQKNENPEFNAAFRSVAETISELGHYIRFIAVELKSETGQDPVSSPNLQITSDSVERALADAEQLMNRQGATSGIDRIQTAFHEVMRAGCVKNGITIPSDSSITALFKLLRENHPAFSVKTVNNTDLERVLRGIATIVDALNPLRSRASLAHPNEALLDEADAMLTINCIRTLLHYLTARLQ